MTIDAWLALFWTARWSWAGARSSARNDRTVALGRLLDGLGFLSKYTALLQIGCWTSSCLEAGAGSFALQGPWLALAVFAVCTLPVVIWNASTMDHSDHLWTNARSKTVEADTDLSAIFF